MQIKTYKEALEKIFIIEEVRDYSLKKVRKAIELLNNPLKNIKVIHITGTNWKGSTCKMVFSVLKNAQKKVWVFTSPHLVDLKERFLTDIWEISEEEFVEILNRIQGAEDTLLKKMNFSFFEKCFLISVLLFEKREVEYAIFEVGFWGLLDSTNVVKPVITAITSIWLDHTKILWNTIDEISFQKAWIIKEGIPIVYNYKNKVIDKIAKEKNAPIIFTDKKIKTNLIWDFQEKNAAIAFEICKYLLRNNSPLTPLLKIEGDKVEKNILEWLQKVVHFWRMQYITPNLLIDWAHNEAGLLELKKYLLSLWFNKNICRWDCGIPNNIKLCFAVKKWKNADKILKIFWENNYILVESKNKLMVENAERLKENMNKGLQPLVQERNFEIKTPEEIYKISQQNKNNLYVIFW